VEVSNNSKTDPAAWVARVVGVTKKAVTVEYPFHDTPGETHKVWTVLITTPRQRHMQISAPGG